MNEAKNLVKEPARKLPVCGAFDVVVVGGGIAGVAAALAAARSGVSVCLLEKLYALGGLATLGNIAVYLPLCDGRGRQVMGGLAEELLRLAVEGVRIPDKAAHFEKIPACWQPGGDPAERRRTRFRAAFNPSAFLLALEERILEAGVTLRFDTRFCAVRRARGRIAHLVVESKSGRQALAVGAVVDATGDADVCFAAGEPTEALDSNVLAAWFYSLSGGRARLHALSRRYSPLALRDGAEGPFFRGDTAEEVTGHLTASRALLRERLAALRTLEPESDVQPFLVPTFPSLRMTRRLVGACSLQADDAHRWCEDAVALLGDWRRPGPVWALPYRAIRGVRNTNLVVAGRCLSAAPSVWDVTRAIPVCATSGEAAGLAAALAVREARGNLAALPFARLSATLAARGVPLAPGLVRPAPAEAPGAACGQE
jgi:2-polyprenyl-6-methoxyphenol hydroxylase-like FAD-dependent oxidoreductase